MSATNRGAERAPDDYYATPAWVVDQLIAHLALDKLHDDALVLDPGCGDGAVMERMLRAGVHPGFVLGIESDKTRAQIARDRFGDCLILNTDYLSNELDGYLEEQLRGGVFMIIGNPPYSHALEFARRSIEIAATRPGSIVCLLLRLAFLETTKRAELHRAHPSHVYVLPKRPSFCHSFKCEGTKSDKHEKVQQTKPTTIGKLMCPTCGRNMSKTTSDATAYGWFVWGDSKPGRWEIL